MPTVVQVDAENNRVVDPNISNESRILRDKIISFWR
jgi:hypothetical protein